MPVTHYCYHCGRHHPEDQMRRIETKAGPRWRCFKSIEAAKQDQKARDAYGTTVTADNKTQAENRIKALLNPEIAYKDR